MFPDHWSLKMVPEQTLIPFKMRAVALSHEAGSRPQAALPQMPAFDKVARWEGSLLHFARCGRNFVFGKMTPKVPGGPNGACHK